MTRPSQASAGALHTSESSQELERTIEGELVPRLSLAPRGAPPATARWSGGALQLGDREVQEFVRLVLGPAEEGAGDFARTLVESGTPMEAVMLDLLAPAARTLGAMWECDTADFLQVTVSLGRMQRVLRELSPAFTADAIAPSPVGRVLLAASSGEQHTLGMFIVAEFFIRDGWGVRVGPPVADEELDSLVRDSWFDILGFSVACDTRLGTLKRELTRLRRASRNPDLVILVGGRPFLNEPGLVTRLGADGSAPDARLAPLEARRILMRVRNGHERLETVVDSDPRRDAVPGD